MGWGCVQGAVGGLASPVAPVLPPPPPPDPLLADTGRPSSRARARWASNTSTCVPSGGAPRAARSSPHSPTPAAGHATSAARSRPAHPGVKVCRCQGWTPREGRTKSGWAAARARTYVPAGLACRGRPRRGTPPGHHRARPASGAHPSPTPPHRPAPAPSRPRGSRTRRRHAHVPRSPPPPAPPPAPPGGHPAGGSGRQRVGERSLAGGPRPTSWAGGPLRAAHRH